MSKSDRVTGPDLWVAEPARDPPRLGQPALPDGERPDVGRVPFRRRACLPAQVSDSAGAASDLQGARPCRVPRDRPQKRHRGPPRSPTPSKYYYTVTVSYR